MINQKYIDIFNTLKFEAVEKSTDDDVLIFDGLNLFIRIFSAVPSLNDNGEHVGGILGFLKSMAWTIRQFKPTRCIIVFDGSGGSHRRRKMYSGYKSNRINKTKFNRYDEFKDIESEQESMKAQMSKLVEYIANLPLTTISIDMCEADDVIAYLCKDVCKKKVTIVSTDKDFLQLVNDRIQVWRPTTKQLYTEKEIVEEYNILPSNFLLWRLFEGDSSDNIPGISGIGRKTLIKEFPSISNTHTHYTDIINEAKQKLKAGNKKKIISSIIENQDVLELNQRLMQLENVEISGDMKNRIREIFNTDYTKTNHHKLRMLLIQDRFHMMIKDVDSWIRDSFGGLDNYAK